MKEGIVLVLVLFGAGLLTVFGMLLVLIALGSIPLIRSGWTVSTDALRTAAPVVTRWLAALVGRRRVVIGTAAAALAVPSLGIPVAAGAIPALSHRAAEPSPLDSRPAASPFAAQILGVLDGRRITHEAALRAINQAVRDPVPGTATAPSAPKAAPGQSSLTSRPPAPSRQTTDSGDTSSSSSSDGSSSKSHGHGSHGKKNKKSDRHKHGSSSDKHDDSSD